MMFKSPDQLNPYTKGLPDSVQQQLAQRYSELFSDIFTSSKRD